LAWSEFDLTLTQPVRQERLGRRAYNWKGCQCW